ncbi:hypothetical protein P8Q88_11145 [Qipengyuania sp. XHP0207]|uniref:hypothetical protein n=1 Tax=Qipengyuania sp. XHP0207 TaxID=3038078 RepID=UPI00241FCABA|nr:hypothetical protein [Qipengyuania sp. XHP0207]MDG5748728.1 hypothetical protein [Qipengyuania sp. XHP0207]
MQLAKLLVIMGASFTISSCGQSLGNYEVEAVTLTGEAPMPEGGRAPSYGRYLKIELSSETSLTAISDQIDGVYAHADFCPFSDPYFITTFGPFSSHDADLGVPSFAEPLVRGSDGKFHYNVYIVPNHPMPDIEYSRAASARENYDLRSGSRDICLRFDAPGYDIIKSRSETVRIPYKKISEALSSDL